MTDSTIIILLACFLPVLYVSGFLHEVGHALFGSLCGAVVTSFGMGTGKPLVVGRWRGTRIYLARQRPFQGITFFILPQIIPSRGQAVGYLMGGILVNLTLAGIALKWRAVLPGGVPFWLLVAGINGCSGIANLLPFQFRIGNCSLSSDGRQVLLHLSGGPPPSPPAARLLMVRQLRDLWEATGDHLALQAHLLGAAQAWIELGSGDRAWDLVNEALVLPTRPTPQLRAYLTAVHGLAALASNRPDVAAVALAAAEEAYRQLHHPAGLFYVRLWRASALSHDGGTAPDVEALDALAAHPLVGIRTAVRVRLLVARLCARATAAAGEGVEELAAEYRGLPNRWRSPTLDLRVWRALGRFYLRRGGPEKAVPAFREALAALQQLDRTMHDHTDRMAFHAVQAPFLAEVQGYLRAVDLAPEADALADFFPKELSCDEDPSNARRPIRALRWGFALTGVNMVCILAALLGALLVSSPTDARRDAQQEEVLILKFMDTLSYLGPKAAVLTLVLVLYFLFALAYLMTFLLLGRLAPNLRRHLGVTLVACAVIPWVTWLVVIGLHASRE